MSAPGGLRAPVHAVTFDLDFTLWDLTGVILAAEERADRWLHEHYPCLDATVTPDSLRAVRLAIAERSPELAHDVSALRKAAFREVGMAMGYDGDALETLVAGAFSEFMAARHEVVLYPDALALLEALHGRLPIGAITNGNADISRMRLGRYFDFTVSAIEIGAAKPSHLVFDAACERAGVSPEEVVHIGDDPESDVVGAADFGMQPVWLNRDGGGWPGELPRRAHVEVDSLEAVGRLLEGLVD